MIWFFYIKHFSNYLLYNNYLANFIYISFFNSYVLWIKLRLSCNSKSHLKKTWIMSFFNSILHQKIYTNSTICFSNSKTIFVGYNVCFNNWKICYSNWKSSANWYNNKILFWLVEKLFLVTKSYIWAIEKPTLNI